ncbi:HlyD family secretion protein [Sansalvadorimonas sp. 2012CJ34-2]|uniref:HlyD family secretion protein n=1 Tax=Parendozoicomonas callyspongiae TaxID=2942213 RepID=A0ABT0PJE6_9GAMM|nr:HlyD family secretion protein [Sansalvadorimonas sp. 2012CJ34-2]MCL6271519.1 HlyD family secretion protein [Sansalvadorimonas sp. 2012CJ34-2]
MPNKKKHGVLALLACIALAGTSYWWLFARFQESTDNAYLQSDIVYISTKQAGFAEAGWIADNQPVHEGEVLARIEDQDYQLKVEESQAAVLASKAAILQLQAQLKLQNTLIDVAKAKLNSTKAERRFAATELKRMQSLFKQGAVSVDDLDEIRTKDQKLQALLDGDKANMLAQQRQIDVLNSQIAAAKASKKQAESRLAIARSSLEETVITSPRSGVIGQRQVKDGQLVKVGSVLFTLVDSNTVWVTANFKETQIGHMRVGQPVELKIDAFPDQPVTGYIDSIWPASGARFSLLPPENATGNFTKIVQRIPVKIVIPQGHNLTGRLRAGMSVVATVDTRSEPVNVKQLAVNDNNVISEQHVAER